MIGFAAETADEIEHARAKLKSKGADWIVANDVSATSGIGGSGAGVMGGNSNRVHIVRADGVERWPEMSKAEVAERLVAAAVAELARSGQTTAR